MILQFSTERVEKTIVQKDLNIDGRIRLIGSETLALLDGNPELQKNILAGSYKLIIGVDVSGRLPALLLYKLSRKLGHRVRTICLAGAGVYDSGGLGRTDLEPDLYFAKSRDITNLLREQDIKNGDSVLIVDDLLSTGASIKPICDALENINTPFDLATLRIHFLHPEKLKERRDALGAEHIFYADESNVGLKTRDLVGVEKDPEKTFSARDPEIWDREKVIQAGREIDLTSDILAEIIKAEEATSIE